KLTGSAFKDFARDAYTTLPERADRPLFIHLDVHWRYQRMEDGVDDGAARIDSRTVRDAVIAAFDDFVSMSIQHLVYEMGTRLLEARGSGPSAWVPLGQLLTGLGYENHTSYPAAGQLLLYPGGISETEVLFPYGSTSFASKAGQLAGNHFATIEEGREQLNELGRRVLYDGAQQIVFSEG